MKKNENKMRQLLKNGKISESETIHLLTCIRKEIEALENGKINNLSHLKFFCDWALHKKIDQSFISSKVIKDIHNTVYFQKQNDTDQVIREISKTLIVPFKDQLNEFLIKRTLPTNIIDNAQEWKAFLTNLFELLEETPVILKKSHEPDLQTVPLKPGMWATEISIIRCDYEKGEIYCLEITTSDTTKIIIPLTPESTN